MFYVIGETLEVSDFESCRNGEKPYAAVLNMAEWQTLPGFYMLSQDRPPYLREMPESAVCLSAYAAR